MTDDKQYTLRACFTYDYEYISLDPVLTDTLNNLFLVVCEYKFVVLEDVTFIPTKVSDWWLNPPVNVVTGRPGEMRLPNPVVRFDTLEQAVAYIDITQR